MPLLTDQIIQEVHTPIGDDGRHFLSTLLSEEFLQFSEAVQRHVYDRAEEYCRQFNQTMPYSSLRDAQERPQNALESTNPTQYIPTSTLGIDRGAQSDLYTETATTSTASDTSVGEAPTHVQGSTRLDVSDWYSRGATTYNHTIRSVSVNDIPNSFCFSTYSSPQRNKSKIEIDLTNTTTSSTNKVITRRVCLHPDTPLDKIITLLNLMEIHIKYEEDDITNNRHAKLEELADYLN